MTAEREARLARIAAVYPEAAAEARLLDRPRLMTRAKVSRATITARGYTIRGEYHGGPYIDLSFGDGEAFDVISVWDYAADRSTIPNTPLAVRRAMLDWRREAGDSLAHDLGEYALMMRAYR